MKLIDYLKPDRVVMLRGTSKADALELLVSALVNTGVDVEKEELTQAVWAREQMMSTGIGNGLAVPHVRLPGLSEMAMALGVSREGIADYESLDETPIHVIVLIAAPQGEHEAYIRLLGSAADVLKKEPLRQAIIAAEDSSEVCRIFTEDGR